MDTDEKLFIKVIKKIAFIAIISIILLGIGVKATKSEVNYITISFPDNYETTVMTSSIKVSDILSENHIIVLPDENVFPDINSNIDYTKKITISKIVAQKKIIAEEVENMSKEEILGKYVTIVEKIIIEQVEIPFETIVKDVSTAGTETKDSVLQEGKNGLKEIKYKVKFQDDVEIERNIVSETIINEPVDKIVQVSTKIVSRSGNRSTYNSSTLEASTAGITPRVVTMNTSAYCSCARCCGKSNGITSSGAQAKSWYTIAAGSGYPIGTVIYIPALADKPNGGWFVVEDRGGAISNNRIDIFMDSHSSAIQFGRRNLECYVY